MRIAFYAPMKSPNHPVPSGDRLMARLLIKALEHAGHEVTVASELRSFASKPQAEHYAAVLEGADGEISRLSTLWASKGKPDLWFCYHPYYKAPDLIGPKLASAFEIPYVTAEASYSTRRNIGVWVETQASVEEAVKIAALNICFTHRDRDGLAEVVPDATFAMLPPFIDTSVFAASPHSGSTGLVAVAMMRPGDKLDSYRMLARALERIPEVPWTLAIVGDGPCRAEVEAAFAALPAGRIEWLGKKEPDEVPELLSKAGIYVWPGCGEAYGLAYLEAQAAGLPVVAQNTAGVPEVVQSGKTGILTPPGDVNAFAGAIAGLLSDAGKRRAMGQAARNFVMLERSLDAAAARLGTMLPAGAVVR
ncbi:Glycosyltransferase involved in cell wall bisynthesis [Mesorhizobium albiziae]|uniref:Glycosyltransferase involved in cell wall bisynthesis n=1 Tax=Neomesorhizobium albiziae TaxID=335020 RepID=A0A1I3YYG1_9HYPH|nr:glycosyltransferase family 4 protein [Mesorhizobium albiziae]GLS33188.1 glycosyl transferase [Mesorhizobium albiziae]SFK36907.1 Glycosyltransferase involved in cell wall bisynthesis [Mesorhizobium albiziae]